MSKMIWIYSQSPHKLFARISHAYSQPQPFGFFPCCEVMGVENQTHLNRNKPMSRLSYCMLDILACITDYALKHVL